MMWSAGTSMYPTAGIITWLLMQSAIRIVLGTDCGEDEYSLNDERCCRLCPPGEGVVSPCTPQNDTRCQHCEDGISYSAVSSHVQTCRLCSTCRKHSHQIQACNSTHNTVCRCDTNYFFDPLIQACRMCDQCPTGFGARRMCNSTQNILCWRCPPGTYSDRRGGLGCQVCALCRPNQVMLQRCNGMQDTVCVDVPPVRSTPHHPVVSKDNASSRYSQSDILPVYCALLGLVVVVLLAYVAFQHWKKRKNKQRRKAPIYCAQEAPMLDTIPKPGSDSGVCLLEPEHRTVSSATKIRDLLPGRRKAVENLLDLQGDNQNNWRSLGKALGYGEGRINSCAVRATQNGQSPIKYILLDWGKSSSATLGVLARALRNIGREDVARALYRDVRDMHTGHQRHGEVSTIHQHIV